MQPQRNEHGVLRGDLDYDIGFPVTVIERITPVMFPCPRCGELTLHVAVEQPTGLAIKIPFARKPLVSTGKDYGLICNECTSITNVRGRDVIDKLAERIVPREICDAIDRFFEIVPDCPKAYAEGFARHIARDDVPNEFMLTCLSVYRREVQS
jgi:hypothetical protein